MWYISTFSDFPQYVEALRLIFWNRNLSVSVSSIPFWFRECARQCLWTWALSSPAKSERGGFYLTHYFTVFHGWADFSFFPCSPLSEPETQPRPPEPEPEEKYPLVLMTQKGRAYCSQPGFSIGTYLVFSLIARVHQLITFMTKVQGSANKCLCWLQHILGKVFRLDGIKGRHFLTVVQFLQFYKQQFSLHGMYDEE